MKSHDVWSHMFRPLTTFNYFSPVSDHSTSFSFLYFSLDSVSCSMISGSQALYVAKDDLELLFILHLPPNSQDYRHAPPYSDLYPINTPKSSLQVWESGLPPTMLSHLTNNSFLCKTHCFGSWHAMRWAKLAQIKDMGLQCHPLWEGPLTAFLSSETRKA